MATKTISIDLEAYEALKRRKKEGQSFSDVIKAHFDRGVTARELAGMLERIELSDETLDALDGLIDERRSHPARAADL